MILSPKLGTDNSVNSKRKKLITNITGQASDKMKLTKRLNDAVDDLIRMGQKYKEKSSMIANEIPKSNQITSINNSQASIDENFERVSSVGDATQNSFKKVKSGHRPSAKVNLESSLLNVEEIIQEVSRQSPV